MNLILTVQRFVYVLFILLAVTCYGDCTNAPVTGVTTNENKKLTITTTKGVTYDNCKITRVEPDGISIFHASGIAKVPFTELPSEFAKCYSYDPKQAYEYSREMAQKRAQFSHEQQRAAERRQSETSRSSGSSGSGSSGSGQWGACIIGGRVVVGTASSYEGANRILHEKGLAGQGIIRRKR
ncbi:MAG: hypothetical protein K9N51_08920 [Candidatus Pacebacteria bacterium]|nr:hypothetical protein [Candidatus Paceibacterota bacterium]